MPPRIEQEPDAAVLTSAPRSRFDGFLPQGGEPSAVERRESFDKALTEAEQHVAAKNAADAAHRLAHPDEWLVRFKRVWQSDGK